MPLILNVAGKPCPIQTSVNEALVTFVTDAQKEFTGFRLRYTAVNPDHRYVAEGKFSLLSLYCCLFGFFNKRNVLQELSKKDYVMTSCKFYKYHSHPSIEIKNQTAIQIILIY